MDPCHDLDTPSRLIVATLPAGPAQARARKAYDVFDTLVRSKRNVDSELAQMYGYFSGTTADSKQMLLHLIPIRYQDSLTFSTFLELYSQGLLLTQQTGWNPGNNRHLNLASTEFTKKLIYMYVVDQFYAKHLPPFHAAVHQFIEERQEYFKVMIAPTEVSFPKTFVLAILGYNSGVPEGVKIKLSSYMADDLRQLPVVGDDLIAWRAKVCLQKIYRDRLDNNKNRLPSDRHGVHSWENRDPVFTISGALHWVGLRVASRGITRSNIWLAELEKINGEPPSAHRDSFINDGAPDLMSAHDYFKALEDYGHGLKHLLSTKESCRASGVWTEAKIQTLRAVGIDQVNPIQLPAAKCTVEEFVLEIMQTNATNEQDKVSLSSRVYHIFPAVCESFREEFFADQCKQHWTHVSNYGNLTHDKDRLYRISSLHGDDVFGMGKGKNMTLIPAQTHSAMEIDVLSIVSWLMKVQSHYLENYAMLHKLKSVNPDRFIMIQSVFGTIKNSLYALHDDCGELLYQSVSSVEPNETRQLLTKILPRKHEVQVVTLVLGSGGENNQCRVAIEWYSADAKKLTCTVVTTLNDWHIQTFSVNSGWLHKVRVLDDDGCPGVRGVWSFRWSLTCRDHRELIKMILSDSGKEDEYERLLVKKQQLYNIWGDLPAIVAKGDFRAKAAGELSTSVGRRHASTTSTDAAPELGATGNATTRGDSVARSAIPWSMPTQARREDLYFEALYPPTTFRYTDNRDPYEVLTSSQMLRRLHMVGVKVEVTARKWLPIKKEERRYHNDRKERPRTATYVAGQHPRLSTAELPMVPGCEYPESAIRALLDLRGDAQNTPVHAATPAFFRGVIFSSVLRNDPSLALPPEDPSLALPPGAGGNVSILTFGHGGASGLSGANMLDLARHTKDSESGYLPHPQIIGGDNNTLLEVTRCDFVFPVFNTIWPSIRHCRTPSVSPEQSVCRYEGLFRIKSMSMVDGEDPAILDAEFDALQNQVGKEFLPDSKKIYLSYREAKHFQCLLEKYVPPACHNVNVLQHADYNQSDPVSCFRTIRVVADASPHHRVLPSGHIGIEVDAKEWHSHKNRYRINKTLFIDRWMESRGYEPLVALGEFHHESLAEDDDYNWEAKTPKESTTIETYEEWAAIMLRVCAGVAYRQQGFATQQQNTAGPLVPKNAPNEERGEIGGNSQSKEKYLAELGYTIRAFSTPHFIRDYDVVGNHSIFDGHALMKSSEIYSRQWGDTVRPELGTYYGYTCRQTTYQGSADVLGDLHAELLFGRIILRFTGNVKFLQDVCNHLYANVSVDSRPLLPRRADLAAFLVMMEATIPRALGNKISHAVSRQHAGAIPLLLRQKDNFFNFCNKICSSVDECSKKMLKNRHETSWDAIQHSLQALLLIACGEANVIASTKVDADMAFLASLIMGDVSSILLEIYPEWSSVTEVASGCGGRTGVRLLPDCRNDPGTGTKSSITRCYEAVLATLAKFTDDELLVCGLCRIEYDGDKNPSIRVRFTMRKISPIDMEHSFCKLFYVIIRCTTAYMSTMTVHLQPYNHPKRGCATTDYPQTLNTIFGDMVSAWERLCDGESNLITPSTRQHMSFPKAILHKRDRGYNLGAAIRIKMAAQSNGHNSDTSSSSSSRSWPVPDNDTDSRGSDSGAASHDHKHSSQRSYSSDNSSSGNREDTSASEVVHSDSSYSEGNGKASQMPSHKKRKTH